ncbi:MAG TPA: hypothetical protein VF989_09180 [Polyangiaceae bacterium]
MLRFVVPVILFLALPATAMAEVEITEDSRAHFNAGVALLQDPDGARYEEAYREFKAAYAGSPSWKVLGNLGLCAMKLERDGEAIDAFERYLAESGAELAPEERAQVQRDLDTLRSGAVEVTLRGFAVGDVLMDRRVPLSGATVMNRYDVATDPTLLRLRAGRHELVLSRAGFEDIRWGFEASSGSAVEHQFAPPAAVPNAASEPVAQPSSAPASPADSGGGNARRVAAYGALGLGVVGTGLGVFFAVQRGSKSSDADQMYEDCIDLGDCGQAEADEIDALDADAATAGTLSIVGFGVGAAGIATGLVLLLTDSSKRDSAPAVRRVRPFVGLGEVGLSGTF